MNHSGHHLGRRSESGTVDRHRQRGPRPPLRQHREASVRLAIDRSDDPVRNFALEHQRQALPPRRPFRRQPPHQQGSANIVGQVGGDMGLALKERSCIHLQCIILDHAQPAGKGLAQFRQRRNAAPVTLDRGDPRARRQQSAGQPARTRPDFQHLGIGQIARNPRDPRQQLRIEQEVLPQRLARIQSVARDYLAQRGEVGRFRRSGHDPVTDRRKHDAPPLRLPAGSRRSSRRVRPSSYPQYRTRCRGQATCARLAGRA